MRLTDKALTLSLSLNRLDPMVRWMHDKVLATGSDGSSFASASLGSFLAILSLSLFRIRF
jgi:hypothetical protein